jgi:hypothetical protein
VKQLRIADGVAYQARDSVKCVNVLLYFRFLSAVTEILFITLEDAHGKEPQGNHKGTEPYIAATSSNTMRLPYPIHRLP